MTGEIFGPMLPIVPAPTLDTALDFANARRPLALYDFYDERSRQDLVLARTGSGGV